MEGTFASAALKGGLVKLEWLKEYEYLCNGSEFALAATNGDLDNEAVVYPRRKRRMLDRRRIVLFGMFWSSVSSEPDPGMFSGRDLLGPFPALILSLLQSVG